MTPTVELSRFVVDAGCTYDTMREREIARLDLAAAAAAAAAWHLGPAVGLASCQHASVVHGAADRDNAGTAFESPNTTIRGDHAAEISGGQRRASVVCSDVKALGTAAQNHLTFQTSKTVFVDVSQPKLLPPLPPEAAPI